jgi:hypothetical protein
MTSGHQINLCHLRFRNIDIEILSFGFRVSSNLMLVNEKDRVWHNARHEHEQYIWSISNIIIACYNKFQHIRD